MKTIIDVGSDCFDQLMKELGFQDSVLPMNTPKAFLVLGMKEEGGDPVMDFFAIFGFSGSTRTH